MMTPELQAELDAVHARHAERERIAAEKARAISIAEPLTLEEIATQVESLAASTAAIRRDLNAVRTVMQSHFGRELVIAQAAN